MSGGTPITSSRLSKYSNNKERGPSSLLTPTVSTKHTKASMGKQVKTTQSS